MTVKQQQKKHIQSTVYPKNGSSKPNQLIVCLLVIDLVEDNQNQSVLLIDNQNQSASQFFHRGFFGVDSAAI